MGGNKTKDPDGNRLLLFPPLQIQLLRLNKQVYLEVLSVLKKVHIHLRSRIEWDSMWPILDLAIQAPAFPTTLHYPWDSSNTRFELFLPKLLAHGSLGNLESLNISLQWFEASADSDISKAGYTESWIVRDLVALATFAAAFLQQGTIETISITIQMIKSTDLHLWSEDSLRGCISAHPHHLTDHYPDDPSAFRRFIRESAGVITPSDIQITTEFLETSERGIYSGKVKFTKVPDQSNEICPAF